MNTHAFLRELSGSMCSLLKEEKLNHLKFYGKYTEMYPRNQTARSSSLRHFLLKKIRPIDIHLLDAEGKKETLKLAIFLSFIDFLFLRKM